MRAGSEAARYAPLADIGWHVDNSDRRTHPVAEKQPNAWGLPDMLGNALEGVDDAYDSGYGGFGDPAVGVLDPRVTGGAPSGPGGSWSQLSGVSGRRCSCGVAPDASSARASPPRRR